MPSESTPLLSQVNQAIAGFWTQQNIERARTVATDRVAAVRTSLETGYFSLRLLILLGGVALILLASFGIVSHLITFNFTDALLEVYTLALGCIILILESRQLSLPPAYMKKLLKYALFLKFIWGRGLLYSFAGTLQAVQGSILDAIVGVYVMTLGIVFIVLGYCTAQELANIGRRSFPTSMLRRKFHAANTDRSGKIDFEQFSNLLDDLEILLSRREKEIAFLYLDTADEGTITFDQFHAWFQRNDAAPIL